MSATWSKLEEYAARCVVIHLARWAADDPTGDSDTVDESAWQPARANDVVKRETRRVYALGPGTTRPGPAAAGRMAGATGRGGDGHANGVPLVATLGRRKRPWNC